MSAFTTIARAFKGGQSARPARGYLITLDGFNGDAIDASTSLRAFQYFPATIADHQGTNYQTKVIPGLSHPLYQWTSGAARTISFEAIFTRDRTYTNAEKQEINSARSGSAIGGRFTANATLPKSVASNSDDRNVDIPSAVAWLRSHLLPEYSNDGKGTFSSTPQRPRPPAKLILGLPGVRINWGVPSLPYDEIYCIMTGCEVTYDGFFHDGTPRMAKVALVFAEIIQIHGKIVVHDGGTKRNLGMSAYNLKGNRSTGDGG